MRVSEQSNRRNKGKFTSNKSINKAGMKLAKKENDMSEGTMAEYNDFIRHLVDGETSEADKMLQMMSIEDRMEFYQQGLISVGETMQYYKERLIRWGKDVAKWNEGQDFYYDGVCRHNSKGMPELRMENFELYKKFIKAGFGIPYYKEYDEGGVVITEKALRGTEMASEWLQRRIEDCAKEADQVASEEQAEPVKEERYNSVHWNLVKFFSERKVMEAEVNIGKWSNGYVFQFLRAIQNKQSNQEMTKAESYWAQGIVFKELYARTNNSSYNDQYLEMRNLWGELATQKKQPEMVDLSEDNNVNGIHLYSGGERSYLTEDEIIDYLDNK